MTALGGEATEGDGQLLGDGAGQRPAAEGERQVLGEAGDHGRSEGDGQLLADGGCHCPQEGDQLSAGDVQAAGEGVGDHSHVDGEGHGAPALGDGDSQCPQDGDDGQVPGLADGEASCERNCEPTKTACCTHSAIRMTAAIVWPDAVSRGIDYAET